MSISIYFFELRGRTRISVEIEFCGEMLIQQPRAESVRAALERPLVDVNTHSQCAYVSIYTTLLRLDIGYCAV